MKVGEIGAGDANLARMMAGKVGVKGIVYANDISDKAVSGRALLFLSSDTLVDPDIPNPYRHTRTIYVILWRWMERQLSGILEFAIIIR